MKGAGPRLAFRLGSSSGQYEIEAESPRLPYCPQHGKVLNGRSLQCLPDQHQRRLRIHAARDDALQRVGRKGLSAEPRLEAAPLALVTPEGRLRVKPARQRQGRDLLGRQPPTSPARSAANASARSSSVSLMMSVFLSRKVSSKSGNPAGMVGYGFW